MFQEILYGFVEEFFSLHSRCFRERLLMLVTQSAKRDWREKNICVFFVHIAEFRLGAARKIDSCQYRKRAFNHPAYYPGAFEGKFIIRRKINRCLIRSIAAQSKNLRKKGVYAHRRAFRIQSTTGSCLRRGL